VLYDGAHIEVCMDHHRGLARSTRAVASLLLAQAAK
jgi:hypothetical protein